MKFLKRVFLLLPVFCVSALHGEEPDGHSGSKPPADSSAAIEKQLSISPDTLANSKMLAAYAELFDEKNGLSDLDIQKLCLIFARPKAKKSIRNAIAQQMTVVDDFSKKLTEEEVKLEKAKKHSKSSYARWVGVAALLSYVLPEWYSRKKLPTDAKELEGLALMVSKGYGALKGLVVVAGPVGGIVFSGSKILDTKDSLDKRKFAYETLKAESERQKSFLNYLNHVIAVCPPSIMQDQGPLEPKEGEINPLVKPYMVDPVN